MVTAQIPISPTPLGPADDVDNQSLPRSSLSRKKFQPAKTDRCAGGGANTVGEMKNVGMGATAIGVMMLAVSCDRDPYRGTMTDLGPTLHEMGRPATSQATHIRLEGSDFTASAGAWRYDDEGNQEWDGYRISVQIPKGRIWHLLNKREMTEASYIFFSRDLRIDDMPKGVPSRNVKDIVSYDKDARHVTFSLGNQQHEYMLPKR